MNIDRILLIIIIIYLIISHSKKKNIEKFALSVDDKNEVMNLIKPTVKEIYNTDMESVRQLATMSQTLVGNGITGIGIVPIGSIIMWTGNRVTLPSNYKLCDGTTYNGIPTPDLRNKFIIGANYHQDGSTLTSESFNLKMNNNWSLRTNIEDGQLTTTGGTKNATLVSHNHGGNTNTDGAHSHSVPSSLTLANIPMFTPQYMISASGLNGIIQKDGTLSATSTDSSHYHAIPTEGSSASNANLPPYYALAFVMRIS